MTQLSDTQRVIPHEAARHEAQLDTPPKGLPLAIRHRPGRKTVVTPMPDGVAPVTTREDPALVQALARAFRFQRMLDEGRYASVTEMAAAEKIDRGYLGSLFAVTRRLQSVFQRQLGMRSGGRHRLSH